MISIDASDAVAMADHIEQASRAVGPRTARWTHTRGQQLQAIVRGRAAGRPGPAVITGAYVGSIGLRPNEPGGGRYEVEVGTDHPEGFRLERGYHGTDSLGRHFVMSHGYPHFGPAAAEAGPLIADSAIELADDL